MLSSRFARYEEFFYISAFVRMNEEIEMLANFVEGLDFPVMHAVIVEVGETPFQENLRALKALDIRNDKDEGEDALAAAIDGIEEMIIELEHYRDAAEEVAKKIVTTIL